MTIYALEDATGDYSVWHDTVSLPSGYTSVTERPSKYHTYSEGTWSLDTTAEVIEKRSKAVLTRTAFVMAAHAAGLLSDADAEIAARGEIPAVLTAAIAGNTAAEQLEYKITWGGLTEVNRNHPLIGIVQSYMSLTDAQVDALFGIV